MGQASCCQESRMQAPTINNPPLTGAFTAPRLYGNSALGASRAQRVQGQQTRCIMICIAAQHNQVGCCCGAHNSCMNMHQTTVLSLSHCTWPPLAPDTYEPQLLRLSKLLVLLLLLPARRWPTSCHTAPSRLGELRTSAANSPAAVGVLRADDGAVVAAQAGAPPMVNASPTGNIACMPAAVAGLPGAISLGAAL